MSTFGDGDDMIHTRREGMGIFKGHINGLATYSADGLCGEYLLPVDVVLSKMRPPGFVRTGGGFCSSHRIFLSPLYTKRGRAPHPLFGRSGIEKAGGIFCSLPLYPYYIITDMFVTCVTILCGGHLLQESVISLPNRVGCVTIAQLIRYFLPRLKLATSVFKDLSHQAIVNR